MEQERVQIEGGLLAFGPHPDDVELNVGGILALHAMKRAVVVVDLTEGEMASNGTVAERRTEARKAKEVLGLAERVNLQLPDGGINPQDSEQQRQVVWALRRYRPEVVLLPYWEDRHPDHVAASRLVEVAIFKAGLQNYEVAEGLAPYRPRRWYYYLQHQVSTPDLVVDVSEVYAQKVAAIEAYQSQFRQSGGVQTYINKPTFMQKVRARDEYFGAMIDVRYGEGLIVKEPLPLKDIFQL